MKSADIYRYVVRYDAGTAPNPFDGWCTLAICKPRIRKAARIGDWVVGFRSRSLGNSRVDLGHVLYAMQVEESLSFAEYWNDKRFVSRRPSRKNLYPDNIYRPMLSSIGEQTLAWVPNHVHEINASARDLSGRRVLVATKFWYFGDNSLDERMRLPLDLLHLAARTQGHVVHKDRKSGDVAMLVAWLEQFPRGVNGKPATQLKHSSHMARTSLGCGSK